MKWHNRFLPVSYHWCTATLPHIIVFVWCLHDGKATAFTAFLKFACLNVFHYFILPFLCVDAIKEAKTDFRSIQWSAITLIPLTCEGNDINHLVTTQSSARKPSPGNHVYDTLTQTTHLIIIIDQVHPPTSYGLAKIGCKCLAEFPTCNPCDPKDLLNTCKTIGVFNLISRQNVGLFPCHETGLVCCDYWATSSLKVWAEVPKYPD